MYKNRTLGILLLTCILGSLISAIEVHAQTCYFGGFQVIPPATVAAGQSFSVSTTATAVCGSGDLYNILQVDLSDSNTNQRLSRMQFTFPSATTMTTTVVNTATARTTLGSWSLLIAANIIGYPSGQVLGPANQQSFAVQVVPYTPTTTTSQTVITMTPTTVETTTSIATTSQQPLSSTQTTTFTSTQSTQNNSTYYVAIACIGLIIVVFGMLIRQRSKKQARKDRTRIY